MQDDDKTGAAPEQDEKPGTTSTPETADAGGERETSDADKAASDKPEHGEDDKPRKRRASARIGELHAQNKAKDAEIERLMRLVEAGQTPKQAAGAASDDDEPKREQFDDYEAYIEKRAAWVARKEFRQQQTRHEESTRREREARDAAQAHARWQESHDSALDKYDDYEEIFDSVGTSINGEQAAAIKLAEQPAEVVYFLGKNTKELDKLKNLSGGPLYRAIGRLEERMERQREKRSSAPAPTTPVRGAAPSGNTLSDNLSPKEWVARRNKQLGR